MKEEGKIKIGLGGAICGIIIVVLIAVVCYLLYERGNLNAKQVEKEELLKAQQTSAITNNSEQNTVLNSTTEEKNVKPTVVENKKNGKIDENKELVYTINEKEGSKMPYINISSNSVKWINKEIEEEYKAVEKERGAYSYNYYINDNYLSLVVERGFANDAKEYSVYNIEIETGETVSNTELLRKREINKNDFIEKLKSVCEKKFKEFEPRATDKQYLEIAKTINSSNISVYTPIFLGKDGKIDAIIKECTYAGAEYYLFLVDVE